MPYRISSDNYIFSFSKDNNLYFNTPRITVIVGLGFFVY